MLYYFLRCWSVSHAFKISTTSTFSSSKIWAHEECGDSVTLPMLVCFCLKDIYLFSGVMFACRQVLARFMQRPVWAIVPWICHNVSNELNPVTCLYMYVHTQAFINQNLTNVELRLCDILHNGNSFRIVYMFFPYLCSNFIWHRP